MADGLSVTVANNALTNITGTYANWAQLHTADPGTAGLSNVSSVTTRQAVSWGGSSAGSITTTDTPTWSSWAGTNGETITDISLWNNASSGTFGMSMQLNASVTMNTGDSLEITSITISIPTAS
jgi:hypothetical protein